MLFPSIETGTAMNARESENYLQKIGCAVIWNYFVYSFIIVPDISQPNKSRHYFDALNLADNFQIREHSWPCLFQ
jgi:hypothetical protein